MKKKVVSKGYTLEVVSWENDGDNYNTKQFTTESKEEAEKLYKICTVLFKSHNNKQGGVGNSMDGKCKKTILEYIEDNKKDFSDLIDEDDIMDYFYNIGYELMGGSEYYDFRVCESCIVIFSEEDIYLEQIEFK